MKMSFTLEVVLSLVLLLNFSTQAVAQSKLVKVPCESQNPEEIGSSAYRNNELSATKGITAFVDVVSGGLAFLEVKMSNRSPYGIKPKSLIYVRGPFQSADSENLELQNETGDEDELVTISPDLSTGTLKLQNAEISFSCATIVQAEEPNEVEDPKNN